MEQDFGVCRLSVVPVRTEPSVSLQVSQLLFGDAYEIIERSRNKLWLRIKINFDNTEGWINLLHHHAIGKDYFDQITQADYKITTDVLSTILYKKNPLPILLGSDEQFAFNGEAKPISQKRDNEFLKNVALKYLNAPETEGGKSPFGICANGLAQMVFKISGYLLPWDLLQQAMAGKKIKDIASAQSGDLAFFKNKAGKIIHAGIVFAENKIIHASGQVKIDHLNEEGILNSETKIYTHTLAAIRRILNQ